MPDDGAHATSLASLPSLLDDRSPPGFREAYGTLVRGASRLDVALTHLRLSTVDLTETELSRITRVRLLLAQLRAAALDVEAHAVLHRVDSARNLRRLIGLLRAGRIEVRSAPLATWSPDFSVFGGDGRPFALIIGPHRFERSPAFGGPVLASLHGPAEATRAISHFEKMWAGAHDIRSAITGILTRAERGVGALGQDSSQLAPKPETPTGTRVFARGTRDGIG